MQHDGFSWEVSGPQFVQKEGLSAQSLQMEKKIEDWLGKIPAEEKKKVVDTLFDLLAASGATTLSDVKKGKLKVAIAALPQMMDLPKVIRNHILEFFVLLEQTSLFLSVESRLNRNR